MENKISWYAFINKKTKSIVSFRNLLINSLIVGLAISTYRCSKIIILMNKSMVFGLELTKIIL
jgi:hypothetical protein